MEYARWKSFKFWLRNPIKEFNFIQKEILNYLLQNGIYEA